MHRDPVCGTTVSEKDAAAKAEHEGVLYYFCSEGCRRRFVANPVQYLP